MKRLFLWVLFMANISLLSLSSPISPISPISVASAHEVRPGYIEIQEKAADAFQISWKQPVRDGRQQVAGLGLRPVFPANCQRGGQSTMRRRPGALVESFTLVCTGGLLGQSIGIEGLQKTITDVFVKLSLQNGATTNLRLTSQQPFQKFSGGGTGLGAYFGMGVEHLLFGFDHILFVLGLVMLVQGWRRLALVVTGFTLAHSLTLALAVLGSVRVSPPIVELIIALSILFVAIELSRAPENRSVLASRYPQAVAFLFGLLHGFGFAGVLAEIGLPRDAALPALALFNLGIEAGQLFIVALALLIGSRLVVVLNEQRQTHPRLVAMASQAPVVVLGSLSVYWLMGRGLALLTS
ncbi:HupE/UreJ family protein [Alphaproteobacteria bacterium]|nr:HupE/UreJ family protein [Alphaproteobacteria bacterium]